MKIADLFLILAARWYLATAAALTLRQGAAAALMPWG